MGHEPIVDAARVGGEARVLAHGEAPRARQLHVDDAVDPAGTRRHHQHAIAQTESCEFPHFGYIISGRMRIRMDDGSEGEIGTGDVFTIAPGHDAEVVGDEPCVMLDVGEEDADYARRE